jgi:hypothetical protein
MSVLTGRYSGSPESAIDEDIRQMNAQGVPSYADLIIRSALSDAFWDAALPQVMDTPSVSSPYFRVFQAAQVKLGDKGFLSRDISIGDLITGKSDVHHIFPRGYMKAKEVPRSQYNQIANYVMAQSDINIPIGNKEPRIYFHEMLEQCNGGRKLYGNITDPDELRRNFTMNCIPDGMESMTVGDYPHFLAARRKLMAQKMKVYFEVL